MDFCVSITIYSIPLRVISEYYYSDGFISNRSQRFNDAIEILKTDLNSSCSLLEALQVDTDFPVFLILSIRT